MRVSLKPYVVTYVHNGCLELFLIGSGYLYVNGDLRVIVELGKEYIYYQAHPLEIPGIMLDAYADGFIVVKWGHRTVQVHDTDDGKVWS